MENWLNIGLLAFFGGLSIPIGGWLSTRIRFRKQVLQAEVNHLVTAIGGGALLAAVCLVLVPDGLDKMGFWGSICSFAGGGAAFMFLDIYLVPVHRVQ